MFVSKATEVEPLNSIFYKIRLIIKKKIYKIYSLKSWVLSSPKILFKDKQPSLFCRSIIGKEKKSYNVDVTSTCSRSLTWRTRRRWRRRPCCWRKPWRSLWRTLKSKKPLAQACKYLTLVDNSCSWLPCLPGGDGDINNLLVYILPVILSLTVSSFIFYHEEVRENFAQQEVQSVILSREY